MLVTEPPDVGTGRFPHFGRAVERTVDAILENAYNVDRKLLLDRNRLAHLESSPYREVTLYDAVRPARDGSFNAGSYLYFERGVLDDMRAAGRRAADGLAGRRARASIASKRRRRRRSRVGAPGGAVMTASADVLVVMANTRRRARSRRGWPSTSAPTRRARSTARSSPTSRRASRSGAVVAGLGGYAGRMPISTPFVGARGSADSRRRATTSANACGAASRASARRRRAAW